MALYYKVSDIENENTSTFGGIQVHKGDSIPTEGPCIKYDFSKHVLIELLDNVTPESKLWKALGLVQNKNVVHKRLLVDPHRVNCRRAIVVCTNSDVATDMAKRLTQAKIIKRCVCAIVIQELLSDLHLFEKQIIQFGDKGSQQQLVYITDLNRPREPASLARYLREKFSPFGTILSVFVSEGEDGYALPEGVIRFAHLSEAFAAELAYDQCAVAMERLSVTTHHNILLSQCDLKARLKKAQSQRSREAYVDSNHSGSDVTLPAPVFDNPMSDVDRLRSNSSSSSVTSEIPPLQIPTYKFPQERGNSHPKQIQEPFPTDSEELADVLRSSCKENLVDCLKDIAMGSESSISKKTTAYSASAVSEIEGNDFDQRIPLSSSPARSTAAPLNLGDKSWSSRVMGWISEIPSADDMPRYNDNWEDQRLLSGSGDRQSHSEIRPDEHLNGNVKHGMDIVSNSGSFVTCRNGDVTASYNSNLSSPTSTVKGEANDLNNTILQAGTFSSPEKSRESGSETGEGQCENNHPAPIQLSLNAEDICPVSTSQKRKNSSLMTQKLSIKNQCLDSSQALSEISETETTIHLPSVFNNRQCYVLLDRLPELTKSINSFKPPFVLESNSKSDAQLPTSVKSRYKSGSTISESSNAACSSKSVKSLPVRRITRRALREEERKSSSVSGDLLMEVPKNATSVISDTDKQNEHESPLRSWLKKELISSTNNRISGSKESTKSILCATANKDVLISVGCSHMTCDFCYPDSTKLLLGCY